MTRATVVSLSAAVLLAAIVLCSCTKAATEPVSKPAQSARSSSASSLFGCDYSDVKAPRDGQDLNWVGDPDPIPATDIVDCNGGERGSLVIKTSGVRVQNCTIRGYIRIMMDGVPDTNHVEPADWTRSQTYVREVRAAAPAHTIIQDTQIIGVPNANGNCVTPLYIGTGATYTLVRDVEISGCSGSVMVYIESESYGSKFKDVTIHAENADREAIAVDASSHNEFIRLQIFHRLGGMFFYRNCGEAGRTRVTTPSFNVGSGLVFRGGEDGMLSGRDPYPGLWFASRNGNRCYCPDDEPGTLGSSWSNMDHSRGNRFESVDLGPGGWLQDDGEDNQVE